MNKESLEEFFLSDITLEIEEGTEVDTEVLSAIDADRYYYLRYIPSLGLCGINKFLFTYGLVVGINEIGYDHRYCYSISSHNRNSVIDYLKEWDGEGYPKGNWIKRKGSGETTNPNYIEND